MKYTIITTLCLFSLSSFAGKDHKKMDKMMESMSFEDAKKMKLEMLDKKDGMLHEARTCVNNSKDKPALKDCMTKMHEGHKQMKDEMKDKMKKNS